jgi:hypothetical protein
MDFISQNKLPCHTPIKKSQSLTLGNLQSDSEKENIASFKIKRVAGAESESVFQSMVRDGRKDDCMADFSKQRWRKRWREFHKQS